MIYPFIVLVTAFSVPTEKEVRFLSNQHNLFITNLISFQDDYQFSFNEYCTNIQFIGCWSCQSFKLLFEDYYLRKRIWWLVALGVYLSQEMNFTNALPIHILCICVRVVYKADHRSYDRAKTHMIWQNLFARASWSSKLFTKPSFIVL